jgi:uncharacterized linocin/CFP29 family protein
MESQVDWTHEQWSRVKQTVLDEATKVGVAGSFLPCYGPLERSSTVVRAEVLSDGSDEFLGIKVDDVATLRLCTLAVYVQLKHQQLSEDSLTGALSAFRRAANLLARAEDAIVFSGLPKADPASSELSAQIPAQCKVMGGQKIRGLVKEGCPISPNQEPNLTADEVERDSPPLARNSSGEGLVSEIAQTIATLESNGHYGPFACILGTTAFVTAHTPAPGSLVMPRDRMEPILGMSLLRSSTLEPNQVVVVALAGDPIDLVVATPPSVQFLNVTNDAKYLFRVYEKFVLRIKETGAVRTFALPASS